MHGTAWEVDVPITHRSDQTRTGLHIFTGLADDEHDAVAAALRAYQIALLHKTAGQDIPSGSSRLDWSARGLRTDWVLDWSRAQKKQIAL